MFKIKALGVKILYRFVLQLIVFFAGVSSAHCAEISFQGDGTSKDSRLIVDSKEKFLLAIKPDEMSAYVAAFPNKTTLKYVSVVCDIDFEGGKFASLADLNYYDIDFNGYSIKNYIVSVTIDNTINKNMGLFKAVNNSCLRNLIVENVSVELSMPESWDKSNNYYKQVGALCGAAKSTTFSNVTVKNSVIEAPMAGGFCGVANGCVFEYCENYAEVKTTDKNLKPTNTTTGVSCAGGFCGMSNNKFNTFKVCYNGGRLTVGDAFDNEGLSESGSYIGGFVGYLYIVSDRFYNCVNSGDIFLKFGGACGGFVGRSASNNINQYFITNVVNVGNLYCVYGGNAGGFIGEVSKETSFQIDKCVNFGTIVANGCYDNDADKPFIGGMFGKIVETGSNLVLNSFFSVSNIVGMKCFSGSSSVSLGDAFGELLKSITISQFGNNGLTFLSVLGTGYPKTSLSNNVESLSYDSLISGYGEDVLGSSWYRTSDYSLPVPFKDSLSDPAIKKLADFTSAAVKYGDRSITSSFDFTDEKYLEYKDLVEACYSNATDTVSSKFSVSEVGEWTSKNGILKVKGYNVGLAGVGYDELTFKLDNYKKVYRLYVSRVDTLIFSGGSGTEENPYLLTCKEDLLKLKEMVENEVCAENTSKNWSYNKYFKIGKNIDEVIDFSIGKDEELYSFCGSIDGAGRSINLGISSDANNVGLFSSAYNAEVKSLVLTGFVKGKDNVGSVFGCSYGSSVVGCINGAKVSGADCVGGFVGKTSGDSFTLLNSCGNIGTVEGKNNVGGLCGSGDNKLNVSVSSNAGLVMGDDNVGGAVGLISGESVVSQVVAYGYVSGESNCGAVIGSTEKAVSAVVFDSRMTSCSGVGNDKSVLISSETKDMLGAGVLDDGFANDAWYVCDSTYPVPQLLNGFLYSDLLSLPVSLATADDDYSNNVNGISSNFVYKDGFSWTDFDSKLEFGDDLIAVLKRSGYDTIRISKDNVVREYPVVITYPLFSGGRGTQADPYQISTIEDVEYLSVLVNSNMFAKGSLSNWSKGKFFRLMNDISEPVSVVIGKGDTDEFAFCGAFSGDGHELNLNIKAETTAENAGLFGTVSGAVVESLRVTGSVSGSVFCGAIAGKAMRSDDGVVSSFTNCVNSADVSGNEHIGGICGMIDNGTVIKNCANIGFVNGNKFVGGICGSSSASSVSVCVNAGMVDCRDAFVGGFVGKSEASNLDLLFNYAPLRFTIQNSGALCGSSDTEIINSFFDKQVSLQWIVNDEDLKYAVSTSTLLSDSIQLLSEQISQSFIAQSGKHYACPINLQGFSEVMLAISPVVFSGDDCARFVRNDFSVNKFDASVSFESKNGLFKIEGEKATVLGPGYDTVIVRCGKYSKILPIFIAKGLFSGGNGTKDDPYIIKTKEDVEYLAETVTENTFGLKKDENWTKGVCFSLSNNIDGVDVLIGDAGKKNASFEGVFVGNNNIIGLNINEREKNSVALFSALGGNAEIRSLTVSGSVAGRDTVAAVCAVASGKSRIVNCTNHANVKGDNVVAGVAAVLSNSSLVDSCANAGSVYVTSENAGGICAVSLSEDISEFIKISNSVNVGTITAEGNNAGGVVAVSSASLINCLNSGYVNSRTDVAAGICAVQKSGAVRNCLNVSPVSSAAGICYNCAGVVESCISDDKMNSDYSEMSGISFLSTKSAIGNGLKNSFIASNWVFIDSLYPVPFESSVSYLASIPVVFADDDVANDVKSKFNIVKKNDGIGFKSSNNNFIVSGAFGDPQKFGRDTVILSYDNITRKVPVAIGCISSVTEIDLIDCDSVLYEQNGVVSYFKRDTIFKDTLKDVNLCDSILLVTIKVKESAVKNDVVFGCNSVLYNNVEYKDSTVLDPVVAGVAANGCDSIVNASINVYKTNFDTVFFRACSFYEYEGVVFENDTVFYDTIKSNVCSCDSVVSLINIKIEKGSLTKVDLHECDSAVVAGVKLFDDAVVYDTLVSEIGCDSIVEYNVIVGRTTKSEIALAGCDFIFYPDKKGVKYDQSVTFVDTLKNAAGCDSLLTVNITVNKSSFVKKEFEGCMSVRYLDTVRYKNLNGEFQDFVFDEVFYKDTVLVYSMLSDQMCDSIYEAHIVVHEPGRITHEYMSCDSVFYNGKYYFESAVFVDTFNCDSIVTSIITVTEPVYITETYFGCNSVTYKDKSYSKSVVINEVVTSQDLLFCDTFKTVNILIAEPVYDTVKYSDCYKVLFEDKEYTENATVEQVFRSEMGCDSLFRTVIIEVNDIQRGDTAIHSCDSVVYKGSVYYGNTVVEEVLQSHKGCDSILSVNIFVHKPIITKIVQKGCMMYKHHNGLEIVQDTMIADTLVSQFGCDSIVERYIKIGMPSEENIYLEACDSLVYLDSVYYESTNVSHTFTSEFMCDSVVNAEIVIKNSTRNDIVLDSLSQVTYDGVVYFRNTVIADTLTNSSGCDSIITVTIKVNGSVDRPVLVNKHGYALFCNNSVFDSKVVDYKWYKNGDLVVSAKKEYYEENDLLDGCYQVFVTLDDGRVYFSEILCIERERPFEIYPNPVSAGKDIMIDFEFTEGEAGAIVVEVYNSKGVKVYGASKVSLPIVIPGQKESGYYFLMLNYGENKVKGAKFIVK